MRILITGITSIHGWPLYKRLRDQMPPDQLMGIRPPKMRVPDGPNVISLCVTNAEELRKIRDTFAPTHVIHAAGVCDLDVCEERPLWARDINTGGARVIAAVFGAKSYVLHLSTDLVFSGESSPGGGYAEDAPLDPISIAGKTFAAGEEYIRQCSRWCIVRLGLPIGASITGDKGAIDWIESRFRKNRPVTLFKDEWRSCILCEEIAERIVGLLTRKAQGIFHCGGDRPLSLYDVGRMVLARGPYPDHLLSGILRREEVNGPPRIGNVALNSVKIRQFLACS